MKDYLKEKIKYSALKFEKGKWFIYTVRTTTVDISQNKIDTASQWDNNIQKTKQTEFVNNEPIPDDIAEEEWFQLEAIKRDISNIKHFRQFASDRVWKTLLEQDGKNIRQLDPQTDEYQTYARDLNIENIQYFNPLHEADAKLLSSQKGIHIKIESDVLMICNANKKLCSIPLNNYDNKSFFYGKAYQHNPEDAVEYIIRQALNKESQAIDFLFQKDELAKQESKLIQDKIKFCIKDLAIRGNQKAQEIVITSCNFYNPIYRPCILNFAKWGDKRAQDIVFSNPDTQESADCIKYFVRKEKGEGYFSRKILQNLKKDSYREIALDLARDGIECFACCFLYPHNKECKKERKKVAGYIMARKEKLNPKIVEDAKQFLNNLENCNKKAQENNEARLNKMKKKVLNLLQSRNEKTQEQKEAHLNKVKKFARQANDLVAKKKFW